jgi:hypothetical protein
MGSLSNLYISQSFISLLHLGSDNTASSTPTEIQDGLGNGIGITVNTEGDVTLAGTLGLRNGLDISGSVTINTAVTASTPTYVNSGNYFTDSIIRITGSFSSGSQQQPTVNEVQIGWPVYGNGLTAGAVVIDKQYVNSQFVELTINQNTAQWFGNYYFTNPNVQYYNFSVSGSEDITGSLWVRDKITTNNISASGDISASNLYVSGTIYAFEIDTTIVSSSIVFTSGSNIIGDEANVDIQTLVGRVIVTGSLEVTSSIKATSDISSSTLNGIGNVTLFSTSVDSRLDLLENFSSSQYKADSSSFDSRLDTLEGPFSTSVDARLDLVEATSSFLRNTFSASQYKADSSSFDSRIDTLEIFSSSFPNVYATIVQLNTSSSTLQSNIDTKLNTSSFNTFSTSVDSRLDSEEFKSTTFATTGSNTFVGNNIFSASVRGITIPLTISSLTASMDCSLGNFFTLDLVSGSNTFINVSNVNAGETISLRVKQPSVGVGTVTYTSTLKFPAGYSYAATLTSSKEDIITFLSFDTTSLYSVSINNFI